MFHPVEPEEMAFALTLFVGAANGQLSAGRKPLSIKSRQAGQDLFLALSPRAFDKDPRHLELALDSPLFHAFLLVWEHYRADLIQTSIGARLLGFYYLMTRTKGAALEPWLRPNPQNEGLVELEPNVVEALAKVSLHPKGWLDEATFLSTVQSLQPVAGVASSAGVSPWPGGSSVMAAKVRSLDWAATALGSSGGWTQSLRSMVEMALACRFPMVVLWGKDLIQIYNDGYRDLMGIKHPRGLGQPTRDCWPEVWHINEPIYDRVLLGETLTFEDGLYPVNRHGGLEDAYFTLCYSPLRDETSSISGVLVTVFETTERVQAERQSAAASERAAHES